MPKKGYILHGLVAESFKESAEAYATPQVSRRRIVIAGAILLLLIAAWFVFRAIRSSPGNNSDMIQQHQKAAPGGSDKAKSPDVLPDSSKDRLPNADKK